MTPQEKDKRTIKVLTISLAASWMFFAIMCIIVILLTINTMPAVAAIEPATTAVVTIEPAATSIIVASTPTATPTATVDQSEQIYLEQMLEVSQNYTDAFILFLHYVDQIDADITLLNDNDWKENMLVPLLLIQETNQIVNNISPPAKYIDAHKHMLEAAYYYDKFIVYTAEGIDNLDYNKQDLATDNLILGNDAVDMATLEMSKLNR